MKMTADQIKRFAYNIAERIDQAATDGQNGSASYAQDRLIVIRKLADTLMNKLEK